MEAKIVVLLDKGPELSRPEFSGSESSKKFVSIDRVRPEFQDQRVDVGRDSLNGAHATHIRNGLSPIITMTEATLHDASGQSQGSRCCDVLGLSFAVKSANVNHVPGLSLHPSACFFASAHIICYLLGN